LIAGIRLAREKQVSVRVLPTIHAIDESIDLAHELFNQGVLEVRQQLSIFEIFLRLARVADRNFNPSY
jgi:hypothetical protein